jgi:ribonuclease HI
VDRIYRIFTDGSVISNRGSAIPGPGGWGAVLIEGRKRWEMSGARTSTTISEMELVAPLQALRSLRCRARIELYSDSEYLIYGMRAFVFHWQGHGWRNRRGGQLQHRKLWEELIALSRQFRIRWTWIKGHNGHPDQNRADALAYQAARTLWVEERAAA